MGIFRGVVTLSSHSGCGSTAASISTVTDRFLNTASTKSTMNICERFNKVFLDYQQIPFQVLQTVCHLVDWHERVPS